MRRQPPPSGLEMYFDCKIPEYYEGKMCGVKVLKWNKWDSVWMSPTQRTVWNDWCLESDTPSIYVCRSMDEVRHYLRRYSLTTAFLALMDGVIDVWENIYMAQRVQIIKEFVYV